MGRVLTLLYHRVNNLKNDKNLLAVSPENFYEHMSYLKENYPIVRFEQNWNDLVSDAVCITFDDGYMDNFTNALPILREMEIPATVFVTTGNVNSTEEFWWDELERILLDESRLYNKIFTLKDEVFSCQWSTETLNERDELYDTLHWLMYDKISVSKRNDWIRQLRKWSNAGDIGRVQNRGMQTERAVLDSPLLTIGAHTVNHPSLKKLSEEEQHYEISQSIKTLESLFQRKIVVFSYPFGGQDDFDNITIEICKKEQICKAAANFPGIWNPQGNEYQIPRNIIRNWSKDEFIKNIMKFWKME